MANLPASIDAPQRVTIVEVSARDGIQNEQVEFSTKEKIDLIEGSVNAGIRRIEVASFVNPVRVPQMADGNDVVAGLSKLSLTKAIGLVLNMRGMQRAIETPIRDVNFVIAATDAFSKANQGSTVAESLRVLEEVASLAHEHDIFLGVTISVAFGCPFEGEVSLTKLSSILRHLASINVKEVALADTIGVAVPPQVEASVALASDILGDEKAIRCHFHNTRNTGYANVFAALSRGVRIFDASIGGIGGCPFAPRSTGNIATEDLAFMLERAGYDTGLDLDMLIAVNESLTRKMGRELPGLIARAGIYPESLANS